MDNLLADVLFFSSFLIMNLVNASHRRGPAIQTRRAGRAAGLAAILFCLVAVRGLAGTTAPDILFINGTVITMEGDQVVEAVAVAGDRIAAVGSTAELRAAATARTRIIDLKGKVLLPGFIDAHSHFPGSGEAALYNVNLQPPPAGPVNTLADLVELLRQKANDTPAGQWIEGFGYDQTLLREGRHPTRHDLDLASTNHPIWIEHTSGHLGVANSLALKLAGITKDTPQPKGGVICLDPATGEPTGVFEECGGLVAKWIPPLTAGEERNAIQWSVKDYLTNGVTTATIAGGGVPPALQAAANDGLLPFRIVAMLRLPITSTSVPPASLIGNEMLKSGLTMKVMQDGSPQGFTAYFTQPYFTGTDKTYRGFPRQSRDELTAWVKKLNRLGYQIAIHANGDAAIDDVLYAYREAQKDFPRPDARHRIEHSQFVREDQLDEMQELGVTPSFFVSHTFFWGDAHRELVAGPERAARISPLRSARNRGLRFSIHLDTPVTPMNPLQAVWSAVNRVTRSGQILGPEQRLTPAEALRAITIDAAWQEHDENIKGSIAAGKFADLVILDENPLTIDPLKLKDLKVLATMVGGQTVFQRDDTLLPAAKAFHLNGPATPYHISGDSPYNISPTNAPSFQTNGH